MIQQHHFGRYVWLKLCRVSLRMTLRHRVGRLASHLDKAHDLHIPAYWGPLNPARAIPMSRVYEEQCSSSHSKLFWGT